MRKNYDPTSLTAFDDLTVHSQLDTDLISLQMKIRSWEMDQELIIPANAEETSDEDAEIISQHKETSADPSVTTEPAKDAPTTSSALASSTVDPQLYTEVELSLANIDEVVKAVASDIQFNIQTGEAVETPAEQAVAATNP